MKELNEYETPETDAHYDEITGEAEVTGRTPNKMRSLEQRLAACLDILLLITMCGDQQSAKIAREALEVIEQ